MFRVRKKSSRHSPRSVLYLSSPGRTASCLCFGDNPTTLKLHGIFGGLCYRILELMQKAHNSDPTKSSCLTWLSLAQSKWHHQVSKAKMCKYKIAQCIWKYDKQEHKPSVGQAKGKLLLPATLTVHEAHWRVHFLVLETFVGHQCLSPGLQLCCTAWWIMC